MKEIVQLYTDVSKGNFTNSYNLIFLAEGYRVNDENMFFAQFVNYIKLNILV